MATSNTLFYMQHLYKQCQTETTQNQAKVKQYPEAEILIFENYLLSSSKLSSKNSRRYSKNIQKKNASVLMRLYY